MTKVSGISAVAIAGVGTCLFSALLVLGYIGQTAYVGLFSVLCLVSLVILALPRVQELNLKELRLTLSRMQEVQKNVYAKHSQMVDAAKHLAELIVYNMSWQGRAHAGRQPFEDFNKTKVKELLSALGLPEKEIEEVCNLDAFRALPPKDNEPVSAPPEGKVTK